MTEQKLNWNNFDNMMNHFGFGQSADVDIVFDGAENRKLASVKTKLGKNEKCEVYYDGETVSGKVNVALRKPGSKFEHHGIKIELIGQLEFYYDPDNNIEFTSLVSELARPGYLTDNTSHPFEFANVEKPFETYVGSYLRLRYFLRVTIVRRISDIVREIDIAVHKPRSYSGLNSPIKTEGIIEDCLHVAFEYNKAQYYLKDVIDVNIRVLLNRIETKHVEIGIIKREISPLGLKFLQKMDTITKSTIIDGAPVIGESIPVRVSLADYDVTPTTSIYCKKNLISVKYFLDFTVTDQEGRRYSFRKEVPLLRSADQSDTPDDVPRCDELSNSASPPTDNPIAFAMKMFVERMVLKLPL